MNSRATSSRLPKNLATRRHTFSTIHATRDDNNNSWEDVLIRKVCRQRCTSAETIGKFTMSHGSLENWPIYLVARWPRGWESRFESNPENYCALVHVTCVQVFLIHTDVNSNQRYIYIYIFFSKLPTNLRKFLWNRIWEIFICAGHVCVLMGFISISGWCIWVTDFVKKFRFFRYFIFNFSSKLIDGRII